MSVVLDGAVIRLAGPCRVEDAEPLAGLLHDDPARRVDLTAAGDLHAAVVQALLAFGPRIEGTPADAFTRQWLMPLLLGRN